MSIPSPRVSAALVFAGLVVVSSAALAQKAPEWAQWGGPRRDSVSTETGLLQSWPAAGPRLAWQASGLGSGFSTVAISGGKIVTMGDLDRDGSRSQFIIALSAQTHKIVWTCRVGPPHSDGSRSTPTIDRGLVYAVGTEGDLVCCDLATGAEKWRSVGARDYGAEMMSVWKFSESPLVDGDRVLYTPGSTSAVVVALDRLTGKLIWKCAAPAGPTKGKDGAGYSSIVVSNACGVKQYVQNWGRGLIGIDAATGKALWWYDKMACSVANITTPVVRGDYVFGTNAYGAGSSLVKLVKSGSGIAANEVAYLPANVFQNHHGGMVLVGDYLYGGHGQNNGDPACIDFATGALKWKERTVGGGSAAVVAASGMVFYRYENNVMALTAATPTGLKVLGRFQLPPGKGPGWAHPVVLGGMLYIRHDDNLYCYDVKRP